MLTERTSGILLHPTSLPGPLGAGDFGPDAYRFVDWLVSAGQTYWQILPLGEIGPGNSPYMSSSAFAGNILLIDLAELAGQGWLADEDSPTVEVKVQLDNGPMVMPALSPRSDVEAAFPDADYITGYGNTFFGVSNGAHVVRKFLDDKMGGTVQLVRNFFVNLPTIIPLVGTYLGDVNLQESLPAGKILGGRFRLEVSQQGTSFFAGRLDLYELRLTCEKGEGLASVAIIPQTSGGSQIVNNVFNYSPGSSVPGCTSSTTGTVISQNTIDLRHRASAACLNNLSALQAVRPCPDIDLVARVVR